MPQTVGLAEFPPPIARGPPPPLKATENASPGRSRRGRRRTDAACRLLLDSRRGNDLFCRISVGGRLPRFSIPSPDRAAVVRVRVSNLVHLSSALDLSMRYWILT